VEALRQLVRREGFGEMTGQIQERCIEILAGVDTHDVVDGVLFWFGE
jgi:hypothetical protein